MTTIRERLIAGEIPPEALTAIATMTFPLPSEEFLDLFPLIYENGDDGLRGAIIQSFSQMASETVSSYLRHTERSEGLSFYFELCSHSLAEEGEAYLLDIVRNQSCTRKDLLRAAELQAGVLLEFMINNHQLLQRTPDLLEALKRNEMLSATQKRRLEEYTDFGLLDGEQPGAFRDAIPETEDLDDPDAMSQALVLASEFMKDEDPDVLNAPSLIEMEDDMDLNTYQKLLKMKVSEKIQRALKGDKEERAILIRDSNRTVALAVVESPKITEQEIEVIASLRNVNRDVLRSIGKSRKFLKKYKVVLSLVKNPKAPQDISMGLLHRLTDRDLQLMTKDKTLSEFLRRTAQRILKTRKKN